MLALEKFSRIVSAYETAEQFARRQLPNRLIEGFSPALFDAVGYPSRIHHVAELARYVDVMHELRFDVDFKHNVLGFTQNEWEIYRDIAVHVTELCQKLFGRRIVPKGALLKAILIIRHIWMAYPGQRPTVLELGSGSGYLPAILVRCGFPVITMDNTQAFYLWQHVFWDSFIGERLIEMAFDDSDLVSLTNVPDGHLVHVPWWKFGQVDVTKLKFRIQVFTANHMLCEMHEYAFRYSIAALQQILVNRDNIEPLLLFQGYGSDRHRKVEVVNTALEEAGNSWAVRDPIICIMTPNRETPDSQRIPEIQNLIARGRSGLSNEFVARFNEVRAFQACLAQPDDIWTDDEIFMRKIFGDREF